jgi:hypothetical protein
MLSCVACEFQHRTVFLSILNDPVIATAINYLNRLLPIACKKRFQQMQSQETKYIGKNG